VMSSTPISSSAASRRRFARLATVWCASVNEPTGVVASRPWVRLGIVTVRKLEISVWHWQHFAVHDNGRVDDEHRLGVTDGPRLPSRNVDEST
jgi:hypothetical protein